MVGLASTFDEVEKILNKIPKFENTNTEEDKKSRNIVLDRMIELASNINEMRKTNSVLSSPMSYKHEGWSALQNKWDALSLEEIEKAETLEEIERAHFRIFFLSTIKDTAAKKWIEHASTVDDIIKAGNKIGTHNQIIALGKGVEIASTAEEVLRCKKAYPGFSNEFLNVVIKKLATFFLLEDSVSV